MAESTPQPLSTEVPSQPNVVVPLPPEKKGTGLVWLAVILGALVLGGSAYFLYIQQQKPPGETSLIPTIQDGKATQGFGAQSSPAATSTLTSSDSVADIEKDLSVTTIEPENTSEFDADLQSL